MKDLIKIGARVNNAVQAVWEKGPTVKELEALEDYMKRQGARPIGFTFFDQAKRRIELLRPILQLKEKEKET